MTENNVLVLFIVLLFAIGIINSVVLDHIDNTSDAVIKACTK